MVSIIIGYDIAESMVEYPVRLARGELRDIRYWNPISGLWQDSPPTFPVDHWGGLSPRGVNLTDQSRYMWMTFRAYDPSGIFVDYWETNKVIVDPGVGFAASFSVYCDKPGDYSVTCELYLWDEDPYTPKDSITRVIAHVTAVEEVRALIDTWWLWDAVENDWVSPAPTLIPLNSDIGIRVRAKNKSDIELAIKADIRYQSPSGITGILRGNIIIVPPGLSPGDYPTWDFLWQATEWGDWKCAIILYAGLPANSLSEVDRRDNVSVAHVAELELPYIGTITRMRLEYDGDEASIPAYGIPWDKEGLVHVWARNDTTTTQQMAIHWIAKDPDGITVEDYLKWEMWPYTGAGNEHEFIGTRFPLSKEGTYSLQVDVLMNPDNPVIVDSYSGLLCSVLPPEVPPKYELIQHTIYPYAYVYDGDVEVSTFSFKTDPFTPTDWVVDQLADALASEVEERGGQVIELKVYVDTTPVLWTNFRIEVIGTPLGEAVAMANPIPIWAAILIVALAIGLLLIVITWAIETIVRIFKHKPLSPEIKEVWSRETLIHVINDFEVKLDRPPTPVEELEEMSDHELRVYCDQLATEIVPPPAPSAWPWIILGAAGVLTAGVILSRRR